jgi:hypothetical protein
MTQTLQEPVDQALRDRWIRRVTELAAEISEWASAEGWQVERTVKTLREKRLGEYEVPRLQITMPEGILLFEPIALNVWNGRGRVDLEGSHTLSRVKLLGGDAWEIMTDSNVPLRVPWTRQSFAQLAHDLVSWT